MLNNAGLALLLEFRECARRLEAGRGRLVVSGRRSRVLEGPHQGVRGGKPAPRGRARLDLGQRYRADITPTVSRLPGRVVGKRRGRGGDLRVHPFALADLYLML